MNTPEGRHQSKIVESMQDPNFYSPPVGSVSLRETHISVVLLTGDIVYKSYRALVRAKVNCLRLRQNDIKEAQRSDLLEKTQRYMDLAYQYAKQFARPTVWVVCGMTASGKSTVAKALSKKLGIKMLSSDLTRKELFADRSQHRSAFEEGIYSKEATAITYGKLLRLAQEVIDQQNPVILDATFGRRQHRHEVIRLTDKMDVNIIFIECI